MTDLLTNYDVDENGVALLQLDRPDSRNAINTPMLEELLGHLAAAREDEEVRVLVISSTDHMGSRAGADVREDLDRDGAIRRMQLFADLYDELVGFPKPDDRRLPRRLRRRRRRDRGRLRPAGRRLEHAPALPRRRARRPGRTRPGWSRSAASRSPSTCCSPRRRSPPTRRIAGAWSTRSLPAPRTEEAALQLAGQVADAPARVGRRIKRMLHEWDDIEGRSRAEGEGQVAWQTAGKGLGYRD